MTSLNPDVQDLFLEQVKGDQYLASDGTWTDVRTIHEVIKVRFGSDVHFDIRATDNGVLMERDILDKQVRAFTQWVNQGAWEQDNELWD